MKPSCVLDFFKKQTNKKPHAQLKGTVALWLFGFFGNVGLKIKFKTCSGYLKPDIVHADLTDVLGLAIKLI